MDIGFNGVKTGITDNAGACMIAMLPLNLANNKIMLNKNGKKSNNNYSVSELCIVILGSRDIETRFSEVKMIA